MPRLRFLALIVFILISGGIGIVSGFTLNESIKVTANNEFISASEDLSARLNWEIERYIDVLFGARGLFNSSTEVSRAEWSSYAESIELERRYPGVSSLIYANIILDSELDEYLESLRIDTSTNMDGYPFILDVNNASSENIVITYIEPEDRSRIRAIGYTTPTRGADAIVDLRDIQDQVGATDQRLFPLTTEDEIIILYLPVYRSAISEEVLGVVAITLRTNDFFNELFSDVPMGNISFEIFDAAGNQLTTFGSREDFTGGTIEYSNTAKIADRDWVLNFTTSPYFSLNQTQVVAPYLFGAGVAITVFIASAAVLFSFENRSRRLSQETERIRSEFISIVSHQIRTPLTSIKWTLDLLREDQGLTPAERTDLLAEVYDSSQRMIDIANDLLQLSRIEQNKAQDPEAEEQDIQDVVAEVLQRIAISAQVKYIKLENKTIPGKVLVDRSQIMQAITNILNNAIKYSPEGATVTIASTQRPDSMILTVSDQGIGISEDSQEKVFSKFFRAENAQKFAAEGSGLGLYIANSLVQMQHGNLTFTSEEGRGTTFIIELPIPKTEQQPVDQVQTPPELPTTVPNMQNPEQGLPPQPQTAQPT